MRGLRKLVTKPGVYFRDYLIKRHPLPTPNKAIQHKGESSGAVGTVLTASSPEAVPATSKKPPTKAPTKLQACAALYISRYEETSVAPRTILFDSYWGKRIGCNPYAVYREIRKRGLDVECIWVKDPKVSAPFDVRNADNVRFVEFLSSEYAEAILTAETIVSNMTMMPFFSKKPGQRYFNLWHGVPLKTLGRDANSALAASANTQRNFVLADQVLLSSQYAVDRTVPPHDGAHTALEHTQITGSPRIDLTLGADQEVVRQRLGITNDKPVVMFAPTWRGTHGKVSASYDLQLTLIETLERELASTHNIFVSLHHLDQAKLASVKNRTARLVPDHVDMNEVLKAVDVLITDYSSILVDFLVLDRPIVQYLPDRKEYEAERGLYIKPEELPAAIVERPSEVRHAILDAKRPSHFTTYAGTMDLLLAHEDGKAAGRVVDIILSPAPAKPSRTKRKMAVFGGNLITNGVTSSLLSLLENIDKERFDVTLIVDAETIDEAPVRRANLAKVESHCEVIYRTGVTSLTPEEDAAYARLRQRYDVPPADWALINRGFAREYRRVLGDTHFDVAIEFGGYAPYWALFMANANATRKVIYQHNDLHAEATNEHKDRQKPALHAVFRTYRYFDVAVSVSKEVMTLNHLKLGEFYPEKLLVCHVRNSISPSLIKKRAQVPLALISEKASALAREEGLIKFISLARLSPEKNHKRAIDAFSKVLAEDINAVLYIVGYGPLEAELKEYTKAQGLEERVIFFGELTNPHPVLASCDCLVFPSDYEGQGLVLLEALTLGVPCIGTEIPPVAAILGNGVGKVVRPHPDAFAEAMIEFAKTPRKPVIFDPVAYTSLAMNEFYKFVFAGGDKRDEA